MDASCLAVKPDFTDQLQYSCQQCAIGTGDPDCSMWPRRECCGDKTLRISTALTTSTAVTFSVCQLLSESVGCFQSLSSRSVGTIGLAYSSQEQQWTATAVDSQCNAGIAAL